jgi:colanic acid/amylovoran biosynthesis glycosyltransferase
LNEPSSGVTGSCAYLVGRYPSRTHTFILNEVRAIREAGLRVQTISVRRPPSEMLLSEADRQEADRTEFLRPVGPLRLARAHARALLRAPMAYLRTLTWSLGTSPGGMRATLWQLFYFGQAMLLWDRVEPGEARHVHVHHANVASDLAMLACRFANAAAGPNGARRWTWSVTVHGPDDFADVQRGKLALKAREAEAVICVSEFGRRQVLSVVEGDVRQRIHTIHCGVDLQRFRPRQRTAKRAGPLSVLTVAQLAPRKGIEVLLDALARLRAREVAVDLVVVGEGDERSRLEARARACGLEVEVTFAGAVGHDRIADYYGRADVFCLPSFAEGIPIVLMEAMAQEIPVVATSVMGIPELIVDRQSGLLVAPGRPDLLADALNELANDLELRRKLGREGRARVEAGFELHRVARQLLDVLRPLIARDTL